jgi:phenylpyruvate tautomerase PptA (4-oxalocrotonate tautomerase family)
MPYIQVDTGTPLSAEQRALLGEKIVEVVHKAIGSSRAHINVAIRQAEPGGMVLAGQVQPSVTRI